MINNIKIRLIRIKRNQVQKRFMFSRRGLGHFPIPIKPSNNIVQNPTAQLRDHLVAKRHAHYHVDHTDATKTSHEHTQVNPLLKNFWKKDPTDNSFQHPSIGRIICDQPECKNKICDTQCNSKVTEQSYVGHATHAKYPGSHYLSSTDFKGQPRTQYGIFYDQPEKNYDTEGKNRNEDQTKALNANKSTQALIHIYSSKNSTEEDVI